MRTRRGHRERDGRGQSIVELALVMPGLCMMLLGAVDFARVSSAQQHLEHAVHLATLRLQTDPTLDVSAFVRAESGFSAATATKNYSADYSATADGTDEVVVTADYDYPLLLPGLQRLRTRALSDGKLHISVRGAGVTITDPPSVVASTNTITVTPPTVGNATPAGLTLTCTLVDAHGLPVGIGTQPYCSSSSYIYSTITSSGTITATAGPLTATVSSGVYTATVVQANGVTSQPVSVTIP